jgi:hypothetical protein
MREREKKLRDGHRRGFLKLFVVRRIDIILSK